MADAGNIALVVGSILGKTDRIATHDVGFNMGTFVADVGDTMPDRTGRDCRTVANIAGHAYLLATASTFQTAKDADPDEIERCAADFLGLDADEAAHLFYDLPRDVALDDVTVEKAIETLNHLAETGKDHWRF